MITNAKMLEMFNAYKMDDLKKALQENTREELQATKGKKTKAETIVKKLVTMAGKECNRDTFTKAHKFEHNGVTYYGFTNGHIVLASTDDFSYEVAEEHERVKIETFFSSDNNCAINFDLDDVKRFDKATKSQNKHHAYKPYMLYNDTFAGGFNPLYLSMAGDFTGTNRAYYDSNRVIAGNCYKSTIEFKSEDNTRLAIILPINVLNVANAIEYTRNYMNIAI